MTHEPTKLRKTIPSILLLALWCHLTSAKTTDQDTVVFIKESKDKMGQPNMVLEKIQADGSGRSVIFDAEVQEASEKSGLSYPVNIPFPKRQRTPDISPLGKKIALRRSWTISVMNWDGSDSVNVTPYKREWFDPRWSPDGKQLALCSDIRNFADIFIMDANGNNLHNITWKARSNERSPDWSPDGKHISFISDRDGKFELYTMKTDGTNQRRILSLDGDIREPDWGPNNRIVFSLQKTDGNSALYVVDPDGKNLKQLTDGLYWDGQAAWDSTGERVAFASNRNGVSDIWILDVASGKMRDITNNSSNSELFPTWVPKQISDRPLEIKSANVTGLRLPRPRMLFRAEDLPALREKFKSPPYAQVWQTFLKQCDALLDPNSLSSKKVEASIAAIKDNPSKGLYDRSAWITPVFNLAFAWQVTSNQAYGQRAAKWFVRIAEEYAKWHQSMVFEYPVACAYDWLHDLFSPEDLQLVNGVLRTTAETFYQTLNNYYFGETNIIESNFATHSAGSMGPAFLALAGEPISDSNWLPAAVRLTTINLNTWIGEAGDAAEGTSYFNRPVELLTPFLVSLKVNNLYPETRESNLAKFADWYAVINAGGRLPAIGDSDGGHVNFPIGLMALYPENKTIKKLWNSFERPDKPAPDVLSLLWFKPSENKPQDFSKHPKTAYFQNQNYQVFRSGYGDDSSLLTFTLTADGHAHQECGAVTLRAFGEELLMDAGQAVSAADCHSQLLIDGNGRFVNYQGAHTPREKIAQIKSNKLAAASSVDMTRAFATRESSTHSHPTYSIPGPGIKIAKGGRSVMMVGDDKSAVPPYYLIYDDTQVDNQKHLYEQQFVGDADTIARDNGDGSFVFTTRHLGSWLAPRTNAKGKATMEFSVKNPGDYQVWILMKHLPDQKRTGSFAYKIDKVNFNGRINYRYRCGNCWQWAAAGKAFPLTAGNHSLELIPRDTIVAKVALIPAAMAKNFTGWGNPPEKAMVCSSEDAVISEKSWNLESPSSPYPELLVASLNDEPATFAEDTFSFHTRFYGQQFITLPRAKLVKKQVDSNFLTMLYPYLPGVTMPKISKKKDGATIRWPDATDTIKAQNGKVTIQRVNNDGTKESFSYERPIASSN